MPEGSTPQWEKGEAQATYVLQPHVVFSCTIFECVQKSVLCIHVHTLVHVFFVLYMHAYLFALTRLPLTLLPMLLCSQEFRNPVESIRR